MFERAFHHLRMLGDEPRMSAYQQAIHQTVKPGDVVVDIGTGSGVLAFFALQAGASKVIAIEQSDIIHDAKELACINGFADRILFIQDRSDRVTLEEKADVVTSELLGYFGLEENLIRFKIDARKRFLKPGGVLLPFSLQLFLVPVESYAIWNEYMKPWQGDYYGLDFSVIAQSAVSQRFLTDCSGRAFPLCKPVCLADMDFYTLETVPFAFEADFNLPIAKMMHGFVGYFRAGLSKDVMLKTDMDQPLTHWHQAFFPLPEPLDAREKDNIKLKLKAISQFDTVFWQWDTTVTREKKVFKNYRQSNFNLTADDLKAGKANHIPRLSETGLVQREILALCDGKRPVQEIAQAVQQRFGAVFQNQISAQQRVAEVLKGILER
ncbi:50S ribosomal protein L11 methyltransferase [candidate division KSB1 bacterium]|nr:50S ribosomal protein L11 methyltransferase [candidate division KSB1 bacterium]